MWYHLAHLLVHLGKLLLEWGPDRHGQNPALGQDAPNGQPFEHRMRDLSEKTVMPLLKVNADRASFEASFKGRTFKAIVFHQGSTVTLNVFSNICFPEPGIPPQVREMMSGLNHPGDGFRLLTSELPEGTVVIAETFGSMAGLTPESFQQSIQDMLLAVGLLDACIVERGFAPGRKRLPS